MKAVLARVQRAMSSSVTLHPASVAIGMLFTGVLLLSMSQVPSVPWQRPQTVRMEYTPHPKDIFRIMEGAPDYVPPQGKVFVLMGLGNKFSGPNSQMVKFVTGNGGIEQMATVHGTYVETPKGLVYDSNQALHVIDNDGTTWDSYAVGYLVNK